MTARSTPTRTVTHEQDLPLAAALMDLLIEDGPDADYQSIVDEAAPSSREQVRTLVARALDVRRTLSDRRRRETELAALYETAGDLSSLRDVEEVLLAIVRRARELLGTDAAYMMVNDPERGDTYVRVTDGIETEAFKCARLDLGAGLGGLVAKTGRPYVTTDYHADPRFLHTVDDVVGAERLVAIQGVPLKRRGQVIGVLFAANRRARPFSDAEVALLISLGNHAAIAIENAALFEEVQRAVEDLTRANQVIKEHSESVERAAALHERLTNIVLGGGGLDDVARAVAETLDGSVLVVRADGRVAAAVGTSEVVAEAGTQGRLDDASVLVEPVRAACSAGVSPGRTRILEGDFPVPVSVTPIAAGTEVIGALVFIREGLDAPDVRSLERAALVTAVLLLNERSLAEAEQRMRGELLDDLLVVPCRDPARLRRRAALIGVQIDQPHTILVARPADPETRYAVAMHAAAMASADHGLSGEHGGNVVLLLDSCEEAAVKARAVAQRLSRLVDAPVTVGAVGVPAGIDGLAEAHAEATRCLDVLIALNRSGEGASPDELGIYGVLFGPGGRQEYGRFVRQRLGPVLDYDAARGSELVPTMLSYFACDGNLTRTAAALYVHVNTLYQRLDRITQLLGERWRHGDHALQVHLALKLHRVMSER